MYVYIFCFLVKTKKICIKSIFGLYANILDIIIYFSMSEIQWITVTQFNFTHDGCGFDPTRKN